jgi:glycosyltransferase involved in cell wall biosynthesis
VQWPLRRFTPEVDPRAWLQAQGVAKDAPILLAAGTKSHQKGFDRLIRVLRPLSRRCPDLHLVILGLDAEPYHGVNQQEALHRLLRRDPDVASRLNFPGRVGNIADWYACSRFFLLPSRYEGFPNVLLEAMASGCVCLAADCPHGPADLITHGRNGMLLPLQASTAAWVEAIAGLLEDPERCQQLADQALQVRQRYSEATLRDHFLEAVAPLVGRGGEIG